MGVLETLFIALKYQDDIDSSLSGILDSAGKGGGQAGNVFADNYKKAMAAGLAVTGVAGTATLFIDKYNRMTGSLAATSLETGIAADTLETYTMQLSNATDSISEVNSTMEALGKTGIDNAEDMRTSAEAALTLADALGVTGDQVVSNVIPALGAFNMKATDLSTNMDTITAVLKNTQLSLDQYSLSMARLGPVAQKMGLNFDQLSAIMIVLANKGVPARTMLSDLDQAMQDSNGSLSKFYDELGITSDELAEATRKVDDAAGSTQAYSDIVAEHVGITAQLASWWDKTTISIGGVLSPMEGVFSALTVGGGILTGISSAIALYNTLTAGHTVLAGVDSTATGVQSLAFSTSGAAALEASGGVSALAAAEVGATAASGGLVAALSPLLAVALPLAAALLIIKEVWDIFDVGSIFGVGQGTTSPLVDLSGKGGNYPTYNGPMTTWGPTSGGGYGIKGTTTSSASSSADQQAALQELLKSYGTVSYAEGGVTSGPTLALLGDNPSGREYVIPSEKAVGGSVDNSLHVTIQNVTLSQGYDFQDFMNDIRNNRQARGY